MSTLSTAFNWNAPVPQPFTRSDGSTFWPTDRRYRPLDYAFRRCRALTYLLEVMPPELTALLRERFQPERCALRWQTPPALPGSIRQAYLPSALSSFTEAALRAEITLTAGLIERLLDAPEGMVGGLTHNYLLVIQAVRLRHLWAETQRRDCGAAPLTIFARALG